MASLKDIKRKVTAVQKTKQITRAMNMVAASKFKAAQMRMDNFRPYAGKFMDVLNSLALRVESISHPLLAVREPKRIRVICMTADRGLCGGFNSTIVRLVRPRIEPHDRLGPGVDVVEHAPVVRYVDQLAGVDGVEHLEPGKIEQLEAFGQGGPELAAACSPGS